MKPMLLCVDVGNTQTVLGAFRGSTLENRWRIRTHRDRTSDEYAHLVKGLLQDAGLGKDSFQGVAISCVVPPALAPLVEMSRTRFGVEPLVVGPGTKTGMPILYDNPREVGADRIVNAVAAFERFHRPLVIIDFGTAITFDVVSGAGEYLGGAIFPGIQISLEALFARAAKLPLVELSRPPRVIGKDTVGAIQSGILFGFAGMVDALVARLEGEAGMPLYPVATGGMAPVMAGEAKSIKEVIPDLTLEGLRLLWEKNR